MGENELTPYPYSTDYSAFGSRSKSNHCCSPGHAKYSNGVSEAFRLERKRKKMMIPSKI